MNIPHNLCVTTRSSLSLKVSVSAGFGGYDGLLNGGHARVAGFDGGATPINPGRFQELAPGSGGLLDAGRIMAALPARNFASHKISSASGWRKRSPAFPDQQSEIALISVLKLAGNSQKDRSVPFRRPLTSVRVSRL